MGMGDMTNIFENVIMIYFVLLHSPSKKIWQLNSDHKKKPALLAWLALYI